MAVYRGDVGDAKRLAMIPEGAISGWSTSLRALKGVSMMRSSLVISSVP